MGFDDEFDQLEFRDGRLINREEDSDTPESVDLDDLEFGSRIDVTRMSPFRSGGAVRTGCRTAVS